MLSRVLPLSKIITTITSILQSKISLTAAATLSNPEFHISTLLLLILQCSRINTTTTTLPNSKTTKWLKQGQPQCISNTLRQLILSALLLQLMRRPLSFRLNSTHRCSSKFKISNRCLINRYITFNEEWSIYYQVKITFSIDNRCSILIRITSKERERRDVGIGKPSSANDYKTSFDWVKIELMCKWSELQSLYCLN